MEKKFTCPHCGAIMDPIRTPLESSWGGEIHYICFNDTCGYFERSWTRLLEQGVEDTGYRYRVDARGGAGPIAVWSKDALKDLIICEEDEECRVTGTLDYFSAEDFARDDETPDDEFYASNTPIVELDSLALSTIEQLYRRLIPTGSRILDLMAGRNSHIPPESQPAHVAGLGLSLEELLANEALNERALVNLNAQPCLPFEDGQFDVVVNALSVEYLTRPVEVFRETAGVLRPGGLLVVVFSNRMFPPKAVKIWRLADDAERKKLLRKYLDAVGQYVVLGEFESTGKPRPSDDKYYALGIPSDPIYALWARVNK